MRFSSPLCPLCKLTGLSIKPYQVRLHVKTPEEILETSTYYFCDNPLCESVYFTTGKIVDTTMTNQEIGIKHSSSDEAYLCYCFHQKKKNIGEKTLTRIEKAMTKNGCQCEQTNPRGGCCLSSIRRFIDTLPS